MPNSVLLVHLSPTVRYAVRNAIDGTEFTLTAEAATHSQAIGFYDKRRPAITVMDMTCSPHETLRALRHFHKRFPNSKVVVIYSYATRVTPTELRHGGAQGQVAFPFSPESFLETLRKLSASEKEV